MKSPPFIPEHSFHSYDIAGKPILPPTIKPGIGQQTTRSKHDLKAYLSSELLTPTINTIHQHLWMAGVPNPAAPLHRQILRRRAPEINEDPNAHLVWEDSRILIKTLPSFLLDHDFWKAHICQDDRLYRSACSLLWSYTWLISHESDLRIAKEHGLVSDGLTWDVWVRIVDDFLDHFDDDPTDHVDEALPIRRAQAVQNWVDLPPNTT